MTGLLLSDTTVISVSLVQLSLEGFWVSLAPTVVLWASKYGQ